MWTPGGSIQTPGTCISIEPVEPGAAYEVRVRVGILLDLIVLMDTLLVEGWLGIG